ncbi:MAG: hypothetical protein JO051_03260 [Acidobacteriaceae bacterium]|nr:hypothetical protein [Acidobacteriaceae bacterium]
MRETLKTKVNTTPMFYRRLLNQQLAELGLSEVSHEEANDYYLLGHSPETAAQEEKVLREFRAEEGKR